MPFDLSPAPRELIEPVLKKLNVLQPLSDDVQRALILSTSLINIKKGKFLLKAGQYSKHLFLIVRGIISGQAHLGRKKMTTFISVDEQFVSSIDGLYGVVPSPEDLRAEEDTLLLCMGTDQLQKLLSDHLDLNILMRKILEYHYKEAHRRSIFVRAGTATEKYTYFLQNFPNHSSRIPIEVAASFLNLKPNTLLKTMREEALKSAKRETEIDLSIETIKRYMESEKPHLKKKLTLQELSRHFNTTSHQLSRFLNLYFNENFNNFINRHRVSYILSKLSDRDIMEQYSLEGLGNLAGFSSKTTFFSEFKKYTGTTPAGYLSHLKKKA